MSEGQLQELKLVPGKSCCDSSSNHHAQRYNPNAEMSASLCSSPTVVLVQPGRGPGARKSLPSDGGDDATGKAAMATAGDWVIRSMSYPYKICPVQDQPRMQLLQPEQHGYTLSPGRSVVVAKGMGFDFTVAGTPTNPNQCVERMNATNSALYSPCPPRR
ncbi:hypothetical protein [Bradyrhizobium sp. MOS002]|uniref:hypothetical protein n=1 Tax=Bradyrhizobium sp. MOS002 TaxID=2133947 RepID=UPI001FE1F3FC|nr:hypothetical protein [Bradyrhizobium sp. MOS002]